MTRIKLCGLSRSADITAANEIMPEYIGFVFAPKSRRRVTPDDALLLKRQLAPGILAVGVFVNEKPETVASLLSRGIIDIAQLHGDESSEYITHLKTLSGKPVIKAFSIASEQDIASAGQSPADFVLLDSGGGTGTVFNWGLIQNFKKPYFLAGGLTVENVGSAVETLAPYAVDVSSGIETGGFKDNAKMTAFVNAVRKENII